MGKKHKSKMRKTLNLLLFILSTASLSIAQDTEQALIKEAFEQYKSAILSDKGEEAVEYVDRHTLQYYADVLDQTKQADSATLDSLNLLDKLMVLLIRHQSPREKILSLDGRGLFVYAVNNGMVGKSGVSNNSIGALTIQENFAEGQILNQGQETPFNFHFYKEEGNWKIDLTSIFSVSIAAFQQLIEESGQEENEYLLYILELVNGKKPSREVWHPVK